MIDENAIFREATLRITGNLDFETAMLDTYRFLREHMPLDEVILNVFEMDTRTMRGIARVNARGVEEGHEGVSFTFEEEQFGHFRTLVMSFEEDVVHLRPDLLKGRFTFVERMADTMGVRLPISLIIVRSFDPADMDGIGAAFLFIAHGADRFDAGHRALLEMLRKPLSVALANARKFREIVRLKDRLADDNRHLRTELRRSAGDRVVGEKGGLARVMETAMQVARTDSPVLLFGETGAGKEVVANAIHRSSGRADQPFVAVNCGAIPDSLIDSELFGHERGAFTGAETRRRGRFERADGGTLFLDEIGELTQAAQARLLRVLQNKEVDPVGGTRTVKVDVRTIAATHRDLRAMVHDGRFREDLFFRLNVFPIFIPPLRQRREDIQALARHFIERKAREMNLADLPALAPGAVRQLEAYDWPGNVRELQNVIERALILNRSGPLGFSDLGEHGFAKERGPIHEGGPAEVASLDEAIVAHIRWALERTGGKVSGPGGAAELLRVNPSTLRAKIRKLRV